MLVNYRGYRRWLFCLVTAVIVLLTFVTAGTAVAASPAPLSEVGCHAEWDIPTDVLVHTPGDELFLGVIHPEAALFERPFDIEGAAAEHREYIRLLRKLGARVYTVVETLLAGTIDKWDRAIPGPELDNLKTFAKQFITIDASALPWEQQAEQKAYLDKTLAALHPRELVKIILQRPTVHLRPSPVANTRYAASYVMSPVMNLYFTRDQLITTARGVVVGRMNSEQRVIETKIMRFVLHKLGIKSTYEVTGEGRLEGGDFIPAGDTAFIGQGLRTNANAVRQLLQNQVFGVPRVIVVKDPWRNQEQMHLDTYFNIIGPKLAVLAAERIDIRDESGRVVRPAHKDRCCKIDVYELEDDGYRLKLADVGFQTFIETEMGFRLIPVSKEDQIKYGINFLGVGPNRILGIAGVSAEYRESLRGVQATWMDFSNLTGGYGAAHCCVQVLRRVPAGETGLRPATRGLLRIPVGGNTEEVRTY
jgi:arginine deiminase